MLQRKQINTLQRKIIQSFRKYYSFLTSYKKRTYTQQSATYITIPKATNYSLIQKDIISKNLHHSKECSIYAKRT